MQNYHFNYIKALNLTPENELNTLYDLIETKKQLKSDKIASECILNFSHYCEFSKEHDQTILHAIDIINQNEPLLFLFNLIQCGLTSTDYPFHKFPEISHLLNNSGNILYLIALLNLCPQIIKKYEEVNTPEDIIRNTLLQFRDYNNTHMHYNKKKLGIQPGSFNWSRLYLNAELFRIGRMEFRLKPLHKPIRYYKNKTSKENVLFFNILDEESNFNKLNQYGYIKFLNDQDTNNQIWKPEFQEDEKSITGFPISRKGHVLNQKKSIVKSEWDLILDYDDLILDMHIPAAGPMGKDLCMESYKEAFLFFKSRNPQLKINCIYCTSWLLSPQLFEIIPKSNTTNLMDSYHLFPTPSNKNDGLSFIFGKEYEDWSKAPQDTSLQRKIVNNIIQGNYFRLGSMLLTEDEIEEYLNSH